MKILFINTLYSPNFVGGAERSVQLLAESLVEKGHQAVVLTTVPLSKTKVDFLNKVKVYYIGIKNLYWQYEQQKPPKYMALLKPIWHAIDISNPWMAKEIGEIIDTEKPDLVHTNNLAGFSVLVWQTLNKRQIPIIHTLRDYYLICPRKYIMFRNYKNCETPCCDCKSYSFFKRQMSNYVNAVIGISQFILNHHVNLNYFTNVPVQKVIYNSYQPGMISKEKSSRLRLGYLGRIDKSKGFDTLLKSLETISSQNWELQVGGEISDEQIAYFRGRYPLPHVNYLGYVKPEVFFSKVDVLVVPSLWQEPLGRIVIEAYGYGVPVIGSNRGGITEIIDSGKTGFIFEPSEIDSLARNINKFIQYPQLAVEMSKNAWQKYQCFTPNKIITEYLTVYESII